MTVEKTITEPVLEAGYLSLGPKEAERLGLPRFSADIAARLGDDTFALHWNASARRLEGDWIVEDLPLHAQLDGILQLESENGGIVLRVINRSSSPRPPDFLGSPLASAELAQQRPQPDHATAGTPTKTRRRRANRSARFAILSDEEYRWFRNDAIGVLTTAITTLEDNVKAGGWDEPSWYELRVRGEELAVASDFDELLAPDLSHIDPLHHQHATVARVLNRLSGRAILADEVGLGKTIEAGLVVKELVVRGLVRRVLVLVPGSLRQQWYDELKEKFDEEFRIVWRRADGFTGDRLIMTLELGRANATQLVSRSWDLVIVDEAHRIAGKGARKTRNFVKELNCRYLLFLTATPVQNDLEELYRLVELLRPGTFRSISEFNRRFVADSDKRRPRNPESLRQLISQVMIRTTRTQAGLDRVHRHAVDVPIELSEPERNLYRLCTELLRTRLSGPGEQLRRRQFAHRLTMSPRSLAISLHRLADSVQDPETQELLTTAADLATDILLSSRQQRLLAQLNTWVRDPDKGKVLVFAQHADTVDDLLRILDATGIPAVGFHGKLTAKKRQDAVRRFQNDVPVMVSNDAGAEGLNLQFANCVINYDLPWNPMRIEQRIGRVHRVSQTRDVYVANLFALATIDEHVYRLLHDKLKMFELLFGQVTTILGEIKAESDVQDTGLETQILEALCAPNDDEMRARLEALGRAIDDAWERASESMNSGAHLTWLTDKSWRDELDGEADELRPTETLNRTQRREQVRAFIEDFVALCDGTIVEQRTDADGNTSFMSIRVPDDHAAEFGVDELHLAFSADGLAVHPEAELCAAGSAVFDELLEMLRERSDLVAFMPQTGDVDHLPVLPHLDGLQFEHRRVLGPSSWRADITWRVRASDGLAGDRVVHTFVGELADDDSVPRTDQNALTEGDLLPENLPAPQQLLDQLVEGSLDQLDEVRREAHDAVTQARQAERERLKQYFESQIEERRRQAELALGETRKSHLVALLQLERDRDQQLARLADTNVRLRAEPLAIALVGSQRLDVIESWRTADGRTFELSATWRPGQAAEYRAADGTPIRRLAVCDATHPIDATHTRQCETCELLWCPLCTSVPRPEPCLACRRLHCHTCQPSELGLCPSCRDLRADRELPGSIRTQLRLNGLTTAVAHTGDTTVIAIRGAERRELAFLDGEQLREWWDLGGHSDDELRCLLYLQPPDANHDVTISASVSPTPQSPTDALILVDDRHNQLRVVPPSGHDGVYPLHSQSTQPVTAAALLLVDPALPLPSAAPSQHVQPWQSLLPPHSPSTGRQLHLVIETAVDQWWLDTAGLHHRNGSTPKFDEACGAWQPASPTELREWETGASGLRCQLAGIVCELLALGAGRYLRICSPSDDRLYRLDEHPFHPLALRIGLRFEGKPRELIVTKFIHPSAVTPLNVLNGERIAEQRRTTVIPAHAHDSGNENDLVAASWRLPELKLPRQPRPLHHPIGKELANLLPAPEPPERVELGLRCSEAWSTPYGDVRVAYTLANGQHTAVVTAYDTGTPRQRVHVDRSLHVVERVVPCAYCTKLSCQRCDDPLRAEPCELCLIPICGDCGMDRQTGMHRCQACRNLERLRGFRVRRTYGKRNLVFRGEDPHHRVTLVVNTEHSTIHIIDESASGAERTTDVPLTDLLRQALYLE
ncbi:MAG: SNF2-related protein [Acidimicrobiales bacterium]|nr:SNF2-related protein [Acidimicrobiales bacterium]